MVFISVGKYAPALDSWSQGTISSGTLALSTSAKAETSGASHFRPISPTRGTWSASLSRFSASSGRVTRRIAGKPGNAIDAVLIKTGRWEKSFEDAFVAGTKTARSGFCLNIFASDWPLIFDGDDVSAVTGSALSTTSELGALFCARVSRYRVVELNPMVRKLIKSGQADPMPRVCLASTTTPSLDLFLFLALLPLDRFIVDRKSPIGPRRLV